MEQGYLLDKDGIKDLKSIKRIVLGGATKTTARATRNAGASLGFWAKLREQSGGNYGWIAVEFDDTGNAAEQSDWGADYEAEHSDDNFARHIYGSTDCLEGDIVWLMPSLAHQFYVFDYNGGCRTAAATATDGEATIGSQTVEYALTLEADIAENDTLILAWSKDEWLAIGAECPPEEEES